MFKCDQCELMSAPGETMTRRVTETRPRNYYYRPEANRDGNDDPGGEGTETVSEVRLCEDCAGIDRAQGNLITEGEALAAIRLREQLAEEARVAEFKRRERSGQKLMETVKMLVAVGGADAPAEKGRKKRDRRAS